MRVCKTRSVSVMCLLLFSEVRVIVVNPQTPTQTFVNTDLISQDSQPSIFHEATVWKCLKMSPDKASPRMTRATIVRKYPCVTTTMDGSARSVRRKRFLSSRY